MNEFKEYEAVKICDLCGSKNVREYFKPSDIVRCDDCKYIFVSPRPSLEDIKRSYSDKSYYAGWISESEGRWKMWEKRYKRIAQYIASSSSIFDFSAGIGTFLQLAKLNGHEVFGTEISDSAKIISTEIYGIKLFDTNYYFSEQYYDYFDVVTAWHVIEHVVSPRSLVTEFFRILRPGGWLFVAVPNAQAKPLKKLLSAQNMELAFPKLKMGDEIHLSQFTDQTLMRLLESVGFSIVKTGIDDHYPIPNYKTALRYYLYENIRRITKYNFAPTIYLVAQKINSKPGS
jgi:SAM-dependent methyltransferase